MSPQATRRAREVNGRSRSSQRIRNDQRRPSRSRSAMMGRGFRSPASAFPRLVCDTPCPFAIVYVAQCYRSSSELYHGPYRPARAALPARRAKSFRCDHAREAAARALSNAGDERTRLGEIPRRLSSGPRTAHVATTRNRHRQNLRAVRMRIRMGRPCRDLRTPRRTDPRRNLPVCLPCRSMRLDGTSRTRP